MPKRAPVWRHGNREGKPAGSVRKGLQSERSRGGDGHLLLCPRRPCARLAHFVRKIVVSGDRT